jgi:hypothetical protein
VDELPSVNMKFQWNYSCVPIYWSQQDTAVLKIHQTDKKQNKMPEMWWHENVQNEQPKWQVCVEVSENYQRETIYSSKKYKYHG